MHSSTYTHTYQS